MSPLAVTASITGRAWQWRAPAGTYDDLVVQLLVARGCALHDVEAHRAPTLRAFMPDPSMLPDMDRAAERLAEAVLGGENVTVFGDYDVDGATSAALLIRLLRSLGLQPRAYIPDRLMEGYGPSGEALVRLGREGASLIVTVDCGTQAFEALAQAKGAGIDVVVVDHHLASSTLPEALAIVNPNRLDAGDSAAYGHLAAVGVAFLLGAALLRTLRACGYFGGRDEPRLLDLLDLVALGTVADVAKLRGLNRAFVAQGLKVMAAGRNIGLSALLDVSGLKRDPVCADLGFVLGPRINAGGRVGQSDLGVRLLTTADPHEARAIAVELDALNAQRRVIESGVQAAAEEMASQQGNRATIVVAGRGWHAGIIGIVAGRLKERFGRPAIVIGIDDDGVGKGSGRSVAGVDLGQAILAAKDADLLIAGGGHAMAAGLTIEEARVDSFAAFIEDRLTGDVARAADDRALLLDVVVACGGVTPSLVEQLEAGGPYGTGWPAPRVAVGPLRVVKADIVGSGSHVRAVMAGDDGRSLKAVAFRSAETALGQALLGAPRDRRLWVTGRVKIDDWGARAAAEMHLDDAAWCD